MTTSPKISRRGFAGGVAGMLAGLWGGLRPKATQAANTPAIDPAWLAKSEPVNTTPFLMPARVRLVQIVMTFEAPGPCCTPLGDLTPLLGKVNDRAIWGHAAGTLMFRGFSHNRAVGSEWQPATDLRYRFAIRADGWGDHHDRADLSGLYPNGAEPEFDTTSAGVEYVMEATLGRGGKPVVIRESAKVALGGDS